MVKLVQLLCPQRHCLLATCYEEENSNFKEACETLKVLTAQGPFNNWCAICGSSDLHYEEGTTRFKTLLEAAPWMEQLVVANASTRAFLERAGLTYDKAKEN